VILAQTLLHNSHSRSYSAECTLHSKELATACCVHYNNLTNRPTKHFTYKPWHFSLTLTEFQSCDTTWCKWSYIIVFD